MLKAQVLEFDRRIIAWHRSNATSQLSGRYSRHSASAAAALRCTASPISRYSARHGTSSASIESRAEAALKRRQRQARQYQRARRSLPAQPVHRRSSCRVPFSQDPRHNSIDLGLRPCWRGGQTKVAAIALANKLARIAWAMMARDEHYKEPVALAA